MSYKPFAIAVLTAHLGFLLFVLFFKPPATIIPPNKKVVVRTIAPKSLEKKPIAAAPPAAKPAPPQPKKEPAPPVKKPPAPEKKPTAKKPPQKPAPKKTSAPAKKPAPEKKKAPPPAPAPKLSLEIPDELLRELEESIAKIDQKRDNLYPEKTLQTPKAIRLDAPTFGSKLVYEEESTGYKENLISYLHQTLNLPEHGEVKIQLTLRPDGSVVKLVVLKTESEKNRIYLEKSLPLLRFPIFDKASAQKKEQTFILTFCNEI